VLQYNFKIDESLKSELEKTLLESHSSNKSEFLGNMLRAYQAQEASNTQTELDLSKYESVNEEAKNAIGKSFKHILTLLDANCSTTKQEKIAVDDAHKALEAKEATYQRQLEELQTNSSTELNAVKLETEKHISQAENKAKELATKNQELEASNTELKEKFKSTSQIATQVQFITEENQKLRESSEKQALEAINAIKNLEKINYEQDFAIKHQEKAYKALENQLAKVQKSEELQKEEISATKEKLNQAIGKLEILEIKKPLEAKISTNKPISNSTPSLKGLE